MHSTARSWSSCAEGLAVGADAGIAEVAVLRVDSVTFMETLNPPDAARAAGGSGVSHKDIVAAMGVTRATVSALMAALAREGLVGSAVDRDDKVLATLTARGEALIGRAHAANTTGLRAVFAAFSSAELTALAALLHRLREGFAAAKATSR